jgi:hypothetical protein
MTTFQAHLPLPEPTSQEPAIGEVLALLTGATAALQSNPVTGAGDTRAVLRAGTKEADQ